jgi:hypothetical protein
MNPACLQCGFIISHLICLSGASHVLVLQNPIKHFDPRTSFSTSIPISFFQAAIWHCLNQYSFSDASFLAERLYYEGKLVTLTSGSNWFLPLWFVCSWLRRGSFPPCHMLLPCRQTHQGLQLASESRMSHTSV